MKRDFLSIADWSTEELWNLLELSRKMKEDGASYARCLEGKSVAMIFEKPSLRTHVTFDVGIRQLGGHSVYLSQAGIGLGKRESIYDIAKNLERWVDAVVIRTFAQKTCTDMATYMRIPVINALTDLEHPCQAVGDFLTIYEKFGSFKGKKLAFIGDGNNVCNSLMLMAAKMGMNFVCATPIGYEPDKEITTLASATARQTGSSIEFMHDARECAKNADIIYTDTWVSMGQESEQDQRRKVFRSFQVDSDIMRLAKDSAIFMHCLPAHRGEEVTDDVIDSAQSVVFDQAENRLHTQKAILYTLLREQ